MPRKKEEMETYLKKKMKQQAFTCFKAYKNYESKRNTYCNLKENLDAIKTEIEFQKNVSSIVQGYKSAAAAMKNISQEMKLNDVQKIVDKCKDHMNNADEVVETLSEPLYMDSLDESQLDAQMEALLRDEQTSTYKKPVINQKTNKIDKKVINSNKISFLFFLSMSDGCFSSYSDVNTNLFKHTL